MITLNNCKDTSPVVMKVCRKVNTNAIIKQRRYTCVRAQIYFKPLGKLQSIQPTCSIRSIINQLSHSDEWYTVMSLPIVFKNNSVKITWDEASACTPLCSIVFWPSGYQLATHCGSGQLENIPRVHYVFPIYGCWYWLASLEAWYEIKMLLSSLWVKFCHVLAFTIKISFCLCELCLLIETTIWGIVP